MSIIQRYVLAISASFPLAFSAIPALANDIVETAVSAGQFNTPVGAGPGF